MDIELNDKSLTEYEQKEIAFLLKREDKTLKTDLEQMWYLMDLVWDDYQCDAQHLNWEKIGEFYSHPVWLLNGLFIEQDRISMGHRHAISDWIVKKNFEYIVDYGGGFGTLARLIAQKDKNIHVDIYEPHPSEFGMKRVMEYSNISLVKKLGESYDCLISTDVLEHVPNPLETFATMIESVKVNGYLIIANAFYPMIKCHLPQHFHFRYTFPLFARIMGLEFIGKLEGSHASIFKKIGTDNINWKRVERYKRISQLIFPLIEALKPLLRPIKRVIIK